MRRLLFAAALLLILLPSCGQKDAPEAPGASAESETQPAPPTSWTLEPDFPEGREWALDLEVDRIQRAGERGLRQSFDFTMLLKLSGHKEGAPSRVTFFDVNGPQTIWKLQGEKETEEERRENQGGSLLGDLDGRCVMSNAKDEGRLSDDILLAFPAGPVFGFVPPGKAVKEGDSWPSGELLPAGPKTLKKKRLVFSNISGEFTLTKVEKEKAFIAWTGKADVESRGQKADSAKWTSRILFNLKTRSPEEIETTVNVGFPGMKLTTEIRLTMSVRASK